MTSKEWRLKIQSLRDELEMAEESLRKASADEAGIIPGETLIAGGGEIFRATRVHKFPISDQEEYIHIHGNKRRKNGSFSEREAYVGILGHGGCEIVKEVSA